MLSYNPLSESSDSDNEKTLLDEQLIAVMRKSSAAEGVKLEEIKQLLYKGADVNSQGTNGDTPLHIAVRKKEGNIIEFLLSKNAKVDIVNGKNETPLAIATKSKKSIPKIVNILQSTAGYISGIDKMEEFISFFVSEFEGKLLSYHLASMGLEKKAGKMADTFAKTTGQLLGGAALGGIGWMASLAAEGAKLGVVGGGILGKGLGDMLGDKYHMKKVAKLADLTRQFVDNRDAFRCKLVENGFDIFQSFEFQFLRVTSSQGPKYALQKLAKDAVNRAINYLTKTNDLTIAECAILGKSKIENFCGLPISASSLKSPGFEITYAFGSKESKWLTASLYDKSGMIINNGNCNLYFKKRDGTNKTSKYFYRRPLTKEVWDSIREMYDTDDTVAQLDDILQYQYLSNPGSMNEKSKNILEIINSCDKSLEEERMKKLISENASEILCELKILKQEHKLNDLKVTQYVNSLESILKDLTSDTLLKKFIYDAKLEHQELASSIADGRSENREGFEKLTKKMSKIDELHDNFRNQQNMKAREPVWFDMKLQLASFTGRKAELKEIHNAMQSVGNAVVCGLGGIGKTELVIQYVYEHALDYENVIWIDARSVSTIEESLLKLLKNELKIDTKSDDGEVKSLVGLATSAYKCLTSSRSLFIFDDAANIFELQDYLPFGFPGNRPCVIVTSGNLDWPCARRKLVIIVLKSFSPEDTELFIRQALSINGLNNSSILALAQALDNFPLVLQQAIKYIKSKNKEILNGSSKFEISDYLKIFEKDPRKLLNVKLDSDMAIKTVFRVLEITILKIEDDTEFGRPALDMLYMLSYLSQTTVPITLFLFELALGENEKLSAITGLLENYAILVVESDFVRVHRLVQQAVRLMLQEKWDNETSMEERTLFRVLKLLKNFRQADCWSFFYDKYSRIAMSRQLIKVAWSYAYNYTSLIKNYILHDLNENINCGAQLNVHVLVEVSNFEVIRTIFEYIEYHYPPMLENIFNYKNTHDMGTIIHSAAVNGDVRIMQLFMKKCRNINTKKKNGWTPLHLASKFGNFDVVQVLLDGFVNVNSNTAFKFSPLHLAAQNGHQDIVKLLMKHGALVNSKTKIGSTPLHLAAENGFWNVGNILIAGGADINAGNKDYFRPLHLAVQNNHMDVVNILLKNIALDVNVQTSEGNTPLHFAIETENINAVRALMTKQCNLKIMNKKGLAVSDLVNYSSCNLEIEKFLAQYIAYVEIIDSKKLSDIVTFNRRQGTSGISGQLYEIELAMMLLLQGIRGTTNKTIEGFYLASNMEEAGDFDDVVFRYKYKNDFNLEKSKIIFLQAKHKENAQERITKEKILSVSDKGDFNLKKYFSSYRKIKSKFLDAKRNKVFGDKFGNLDCEFIIFTNALLKTNKIEKWLEKMSLTTDNVLGFAETAIPQCNFFYEIIFDGNRKELVDLLKYSSNCKNLSKKLVDCITENEIIDVDKGILKTYHAALADHVFEKSKSQGKFRDSFLNNDNTNCFWQSFLEELCLKNEFKSKSVDEIKSELQQKNIRLPQYFGSFKEKDILHDLPKDIVEEDEIRCFLSQLKLYVNQPDEGMLVKIIKEKIQSTFLVDQNDVDTIFSDVFSKMQKWWKDEHYCLTENNKFFQDSIKISVWFNVKKPVDLFTGREQELESLHSLINQSPERVTVITQMTSISGLGGIGKTELAREYINNHSQAYDNNVIWINAENEGTLVESFHSLAEQKLKISTKNGNGKELDIQLIAGKVYNFFAKRSSLFIFDNAEKSDAFIRCLPLRCLAPDVKKPYILITSRFRDWDKGIKVMDLNELKVDDAIKFVKKGLRIMSNSHDQDIQHLVEKLQCFPLAIQQAISYIEDQKEVDEYELSDYLEEYNRKTAELLQSKTFQGIDNDYAETAFTTWKITMDKIGESYPDGKLSLEILNTLAYFSSENISRNIFFRIEGVTEVQIKSAVRLLVKYSMLNSEQNQRVLNIHRLVQEVIRLEIKELKKEECQLKRALSLIKNNLENKNLVHAMTAWNHAAISNKFKSIVQEFSALPSSIVYELDKNIRYKEANIFGFQVVQLLSNVIGPLHLDTLNAKNNLAVVLKSQGKYDDALQIFQQVFDEKNILLGLSDHSTLTTKNSMASVLDKLGKFDAALQAYQEVHEIRINTCGPDHPVSLNTRHDIAVVLRNQGKYNDALEHLHYVLMKREEKLGADHIDTLTTKHNIGITLVLQGKYDNSLQTYKDVYNKRAAILGPNHPDTIRTKENISEVLIHQGKLNDALQVLQEVLEENKEKLGTDHPDTLLTKTNMAYVLEKLGKFEQALEIYDEVLDILSQEDNLGPEHPYTLLIKNNIAYALDKNGKYNAAMQVYEEVYDKRMQILGQDHPSTLNTRNNIAGVLCNQGKHDLSLRMFQDLLVERSDKLGTDHPNTLYTKSCLAGVLNKKRKFAEALALYQEVLGVESTSLGQGHVSTLITKHNIGLVLVNQGNYCDALKVYEEVFEKRRTILGDDHPETLNTKHNLALVFEGQGDYAMALNICQEVFEKRNSILGSDHPDTLNTSHNLAVVLEKQSNFSMALQTYQHVFEKRKTILGANHPDTEITKMCMEQLIQRLGVIMIS